MNRPTQLLHVTWSSHDQHMAISINNDDYTSPTYDVHMTLWTWLPSWWLFSKLLPLRELAIVGLTTSVCIAISAATPAVGAVHKW